VSYILDLTPEQRQQIAELTFRPLAEFPLMNGDMVVATYYPDRQYYCTSEARHDELRAMCAQWLEEGKIEIISERLPGGVAAVQARGAQE